MTIAFPEGIKELDAECLRSSDVAEVSFPKSLATVKSAALA